MLNEMLIDSFVIFFRPHGLFEASFLRNYFWQEAVEREALPFFFRALFITLIDFVRLI